jgi:hypothetical protein
MQCLPMGGYIFKLPQVGCSLPLEHIWLEMFKTSDWAKVMHHV